MSWRLLPAPGSPLNRNAPEDRKTDLVRSMRSLPESTKNSLVTSQMLTALWWILFIQKCARMRKSKKLLKAMIGKFMSEVFFPVSLTQPHSRLIWKIRRLMSSCSLMRKNTASSSRRLPSGSIANFMVIRNKSKGLPKQIKGSPLPILTNQQHNNHNYNNSF